MPLVLSAPLVTLRYIRSFTIGGLSPGEQPTITVQYADALSDGQGNVMFIAGTDVSHTFPYDAVAAAIGSNLATYQGMKAVLYDLLQTQGSGTLA